LDIIVYKHFLKVEVTNHEVSCFKVSIFVSPNRAPG